MPKMHEQGKSSPSRNQSQLTTAQMKLPFKREQINRLLGKPKQLYPLFNVFQLQSSRFAHLPVFSALKEQIGSFNEELKSWRKGDGEIKNAVTSYYLYQNLFSRVKYISNYNLTVDEAKKSILQVQKWFALELPKVRNQVPPKPNVAIKAQLIPQNQEVELQDYIQSNVIKKELKVYETMARTAHADFFPPKQRILEYRRKSIFQGAHSNNFSNHKASSSMVSLDSKNMLEYRRSFATTRSTFKNTTRTESRKEVRKQNQIVENKQQEEVDLGELDNAEREKKVSQDELMKQNIVQQVFEQDRDEGDEELMSEEESNRGKQMKKKFVDSVNCDEVMRSQEVMKDGKQSTMRRILEEKKKIVQEKMQSLNLKQMMLNWAAVKSKQKSDEARRLERVRLANKFERIEYHPGTSRFSSRLQERKQSVPQFRMMERSKSSQSQYVESDRSKVQIQGLLKTYGRFLNHHVEITSSSNEKQVSEQIDMFRRTSLTNYSAVQGKKQPFSHILLNNGAERYNYQAQNEAEGMRQKLTKNLIPIERGKIYGALSTNTDGIRFELKDHAIKKDLMSNPYFPKSVAKSKKKK